MLPTNISFLNWFSDPQQMIKVREYATREIKGLLNMIRALRDHNAELEKENARYKRALTQIANFANSVWGERVTDEMIFDLSYKAQRALDDLPF